MEHVHPTFDQALDDVRRLSLRSQPVRGLLWLAMMATDELGLAGEINSPRMMDLARELAQADTAGLRFRTWPAHDIDAFVADFPRKVVFPDIRTSRGAAMISMKPAVQEHPWFDCNGIAGGRLNGIEDESLTVTIADAREWSVMGLALRHRYLDGEVDRLDPEWAYTRVRGFQPLLPMPWMQEQLHIHGFDARAPILQDSGEIGRLGFHEPLAMWAPAWRDAAGRVHDVFDFLAERVALDGLERLTRLATRTAGLEAAGARLAALQAARVHDIALHEYRPLHAAQHHGGENGSYPIEPQSVVHRSVALMAVAGADVTMTAWGRDRRFGHDIDDIDRYSLANALYAIDNRFVDESRLAALQRLRDLGHDVVVAHVDDHHADRSFHGLPLNSALRRGEVLSAAHLVEWGADEKAVVDDNNDCGTVLALAQEDEQFNPDAQAMRVLRSAIARREACRALEDLAPMERAARLV